MRKRKRKSLSLGFGSALTFGLLGSVVVKLLPTCDTSTALFGPLQVRFALLRVTFAKAKGGSLYPRDLLLGDASDYANGTYFNVVPAGSKFVQFLWTELQVVSG